MYTCLHIQRCALYFFLQAKGSNNGPSVVAFPHQISIFHVETISFQNFVIFVILVLHMMRWISSCFSKYCFSAVRLGLGLLPPGQQVWFKLHHIVQCNQHKICHMCSMLSWRPSFPIGVLWQKTTGSTSGGELAIVWPLQCWTTLPLRWPKDSAECQQ